MNEDAMDDLVARTTKMQDVYKFQNQSFPYHLSQESTSLSEKSDYLQSQIGTPDGDDKPNKKFYDPRVWLREGEQTFVQRLKQAFEDLNCVDRNAV